MSTKILLIRPTNTNYNYELEVARVHAALCEAGYEAEIQDIATAVSRDYDHIWVFHILDLYYSRDAHDIQLSTFHSNITIAREHATYMVNWSMEGLSTEWFETSFELANTYKLNWFVDFGLFAQHMPAVTDSSLQTIFCFNGLTTEEREKLSNMAPPTDRPIPWSLIGRRSEERVLLAHQLATQYSAKGFLYLSNFYTALAPSEGNISFESFTRILEKSVFAVWCSHGTFFYMEPQRFREAVLHGSLPVKSIVKGTLPDNVDFLSYTLVENDRVVETLQSLDKEAYWERLKADWLATPPLAASVEQLLGTIHDRQP